MTTKEMMAQLLEQNAKMNARFEVLEASVNGTPATNKAKAAKNEADVQAHVANGGKKTTVKAAAPKVEKKGGEWNDAIANGLAKLFDVEVTEYVNQKGASTGYSFQRNGRSVYIPF